MEGEETGVFNGEAIFGSTREVEVASEVEARIVGILMEDMLMIEGVEKIKVSKTPVKISKIANSLKTGNTILEESTTSIVLSWFGLTMIVTMGCFVTITTSY